MKIFSTFDTEFKRKIIENEKKKYWDKHFKVVSHWKFYYYFFVILPSIFTWIWIIVYLIILFLIWMNISDDFKLAYYIIWFILFLILFVPLIFKIIKKYIDYILDFIVINPYNIIYYDQESILNRKWRTVDVEKIKTVTVKKEWLLRSIFNFWNIVILTEWDEQWQWEINFSFIDNPDVVKQEIFDIINSREK